MRNVAFVLALCSVAVLAACGADPTPAAAPADGQAIADVAPDAGPALDSNQGADAVAAADAVTAVAAGPLAPTPEEQAHLDLLRQARVVSAQFGDALWPGFALHKLGQYWVHRLSASQARGFLLAPSQVPAGAQPVPGQADLYRYDAAAADLPNREWDTAEFDLNGQTLVAQVVDYASVGRPLQSLRRASTLYFDHLRFFEQGWPPPPGCGQTNHWSDNGEARALLFAEDLALEAALLSDDPSEITLRLGDFAQFRARSWDLDPMILTMYDAYEQGVAVSRWVTENLVVALGLQSQSRLRTQIRQQLMLANTVPMAQMTPVMADHSYWVGMALLERARWLGWPVADTYSQGKTVTKLVLDSQGGASAERLAAAKARYSWPALQKRADELGPATTTRITP